MGVHRHNGREILELEVPHGLGRAEFEPRHPIHLLDAPGVELCRAPDGVEVHGPVLLEAGQGLGAHAALAHHHAHAELADDVGLVRLLADAGGGAGGGHLPAPVRLLGHHGAAVVDHAALQVHGRIVAHQVMVHGIAARERGSVQQHDIAHLQRTDGGLVDGRLQHHLAAGPLEAGLVHHRDGRHRRIAIEPFLDCARLRIDHDAQAPEGPAVVRHRHEEAGGQAVERAHLAADERDAPAEAHGAHAEPVHRLHDLGLERRQSRVGVHIVQRAEQLLLGLGVAAGAIAADAHADGARGAALALRLPHGVQDALAHTLDRAVGAAKMRQL